ncbi:unnamed protein product [Discosporangium mesarthrocarpum]
MILTPSPVTNGVNPCPKKRYERLQDLDTLNLNAMGRCCWRQCLNKFKEESSTSTGILRDQQRRYSSYKKDGGRKVYAASTFVLPKETLMARGSLLRAKKLFATASSATL